MENVQISPTVQPCQVLLITNDELPIKALRSSSFLPMTHQIKQSQKTVSVISARLNPKEGPRKASKKEQTLWLGTVTLKKSCWKNYWG